MKQPIPDHPTTLENIGVLAISGNLRKSILIGWMFALHPSVLQDRNTIPVTTSTTETKGNAMKFYTAEYSHERDRMEKTSPLFDTYREAKDYLEACGKRNSENELTGMIANDYHITFPESEFKSVSSDGRLTSSIKLTTTGCRAILMSKSGRTQTRLFRTKYQNNQRAAQEWIHEQIQNYEHSRINP